jgi:predicted dehydrogenase
MKRLVFPTLIMCAAIAVHAADEVRLVTLDPGHFHASLVQKFMYPQVSREVRVYAPQGPDLSAHLQRIEDFNRRAENPTHWEEKVYRGDDFLKQMLKERAGNVVVISGNNTRKTEYIQQSVEAGFHVLADKPMAITPEGFDLLRQAVEQAGEKHVLLYDIMTERFEIVSIIRRELARVPEVFGELQKGSDAQPAVEMESVHYFFKEVAGKPLIRPAWFFDVRQEGEAIQDVGTHLIDLVQWECFPEQSLDWRRDIKVTAARRWPTKLTLEQFKRATGVDAYPGFLKRDVDGQLNVFQNGEVAYSIRGVHAKVTARWDFEPPSGAKDSHYSILRGTKARLVILQRAEQHYVPTLYVESGGDRNPAFERRLRQAIAQIAKKYQGVDVKSTGLAWQVIIPEKLQVGHEAHFAQVTEHFLRYLAEGKLPKWEMPNMLAKYYTTTEAYRLSR